MIPLKWSLSVVLWEIQNTKHFSFWQFSAFFTSVLDWRARNDDRIKSNDHLHLMRMYTHSHNLMFAHAHGAKIYWWKTDLPFRSNDSMPHVKIDPTWQFLLTHTTCEMTYSRKSDLMHSYIQGCHFSKSELGPTLGILNLVYWVFSRGVFTLFPTKQRVSTCSLLVAWVLFTNTEKTCSRVYKQNIDITYTALIAFTTSALLFLKRDHVTISSIVCIQAYYINNISPPSTTSMIFEALKR